MLVAFRSSSVKSVNIKGGKGGHFLEYIIKEYRKNKCLKFMRKDYFLFGFNGQ